MKWTPAQLLAAYQALGSPGVTAATVATLNAQTTTSPPVDITAGAVRGLLYVRGSWTRVQEVALPSFATSGLTLASGATATQIVALCTTLVDLARSNATLQCSLSSVWTKLQSDLALLIGTTMSDGKGILWGAGQFATGDPGDASVLTSALVQPTVNVWRPPVDMGALQVATGVF